MQQLYLPQACYQCARLDRHPQTHHPQVEHRLSIIRRFEKARERGLTVREACEIAGVSRSTVYRWMDAYRSGGYNALRPESRRPHRVRSPQVPRETERRFVELRTDHPAEGVHYDRDPPATRGIRHLLCYGRSRVFPFTESRTHRTDKRGGIPHKMPSKITDHTQETTDSTSHCERCSMTEDLSSPGPSLPSVSSTVSSATNSHPAAHSSTRPKLNARWSVST